MRPKVSVCITTFNRAALLDKTLESLASQTRLPDELIVSDDCSQDNTAEVVNKWKKRFPRLQYSRNERNLNMPGNLNAAIALAKGEYIANLHDADTFHPRLLEKWEAALDQYPTAGFVFCGVGGWIDKRSSENGIILHDVDPLTPGRVFFEQYFLHKFSSIVWGTVMARRTAYDELLPFDSKYGFVSDVDMWMRMCHKFDVAYVREPLIVLDHSPTAERNPGHFNWNWLDNVRRMQVENIQRFYADEPQRLRQELRRHHRIAQQVYLRRLAGRVWHRDWEGVKEGMRRCKELNWPTRILGVLANGF